ncbi:O-antigen ligase family protein [Cesiribacter andamanensis]|uniref:Lipid A core-O-antigen ligase n=1 Tax=Cesiribacter andamanensis AMV16 TaxID=1279009 RepID=M7N5R1_9BACT|nr:O-antigen ligase family protein [Cesiribacter andamanensis]EMR02571.1 Lipid A core - O-antigen ligase [Cesiribacter andamanensis AMV16]
MDLSKLIGLGVFAAYLPFILLKRVEQVRRSYILYILCIYPFIDLFITPVRFGAFTAFDGISLISFLVLFSRLQFTFTKNGRYLTLFLALLFVLLVGAVQSEYVAAALLPFVKLILLFFFAKCILDEVNENPAFGLQLIRLLKIMALISLLVLAFQLVLGLRFTIYPVLNTNTNTGAESALRFPSFFHDAQKYAQFAAMASFLFFINTQQKPLSVLKRLVLFGAVVAGLILSGGRAAFLGLSVGIAFLILMGPLKYKLLGLLGIGMVILIGLSVGDKIPLFNRSESVDESYEIRNRYWQQALRIWEEHQTWGIGIGNYQNYVAQYARDQFWLMENGDILYFDHPESGYLKFLVEFGLIGFILSMLFVLIPVGSFFTAYLRHRCFIPFFLIASIISWMISFTTVYTLSDLRISVLLCTLLCLLIKSNPIFAPLCSPRS